MFDSPRQAIRAAVDLQDRFVEETLADPKLPLTVGIGLDAGEAVPVEGGFRGGALNLAARLCGQAGPGEILATQEIVHLARRIDGVAYADRGQVALKGLTDPVTIVRVSSAESDAAERLRPLAPPRTPAPSGTDDEKRSGRSRRRILIGALAIVVVAAAVAIPLALSGDEESAGLEAIPPNSIGALDPATGRIDRSVALRQRRERSRPGRARCGW